MSGGWAPLLRALDHDPDIAAHRLSALLDKLRRIFEWRGCHEPIEAAYEVVDRVAEKIRRGATLTTTVERFASGFITPVFHEYLRRRQREAAAIGELPAEFGWDEIDQERERWLACLDHCLESALAAPEREMILQFHARDGADRIRTRAAMAEAKGKTVNALRIEAHRIRKKLRGCVERCLERGDQEKSSQALER